MNLKSLWQRLNYFGNGNCIVLLYHRVLETEYDPYALCVSPQKFYAQLEYLKRKYVFIDIDEFCYTLERGKKFPKNALMISFDDGYWDNSFYALPILESLNLKAIFYLTTHQLHSKELFWWDELALIRKDLLNDTHKYNHLMSKYNYESPEKFFNFTYEACKYSSSIEVRELLLNELRILCPADIRNDKQYRYMNNFELKKLMNSRAVTLGTHTVNHLSLASLSLQDQRKEIFNSVKDLELYTGHKVEHFSIPFGGKSNFNEGTLGLCKEFDFRSVAAVYSPSFLIRSKTAFPRFTVTDLTPERLHSDLAVLVK